MVVWKLFDEIYKLYTYALHTFAPLSNSMRFSRITSNFRFAVLHFLYFQHSVHHFSRTAGWKNNEHVLHRKCSSTGLECGAVSRFESQGERILNSVENVYISEKIRKAYKSWKCKRPLILLDTNDSTANCNPLSGDPLSGAHVFFFPILVPNTPDVSSVVC